MVKLVEIEDESVYDDDSQYTTDDESESLASLSDKEGDLLDEDEEFDSDFEDDDDDLLEESFLERIVALKDIIPSHHRQAISSTASSVYNWGNFGVRLAGKLGWVFTTSALLVVFPLALETDRDKMMQQWESEQGMAQGHHQPGMGGAPGIPGIPGSAPAPGMVGPAPGLAAPAQ
ncbi:hypothetical protein GQ54DRAFT_298112 [Martensiomyces pterosporus]|nr:hypothetical protein GQ54DRAFT_298112 [Martensiomyces pterosporus]